jgi:cytochrome c2
MLLNSSSRIPMALFCLAALLLVGCGDAERISAGEGKTVRRDAEPFTVDLEDREAAKKGRRLFMKRGCATCHEVKTSRRLSGPSLAGISARMDPIRIRAWIRDPQGEKPGAAMPGLPADAAPEEAELITAYLLRLKPPADPFAKALEAAQKASRVELDLEDPAVAKSGFKIFRRLCLQCHPKGEASGEHQLVLDGVGSRLDADALRRWVRNPESQKPGTAMPAWRGSPEDLERVVAHLLTLKN